MFCTKREQTLSYLPCPTKWGIELTYEAYASYMRRNGCETLTTRLYILLRDGASHDAFVTDPSYILHNGIAAIKCPF